MSYISAVIHPAPNGGLTVVTGPSDSGKTNILRILKWVFFNTPSGTDFIRVGASFARATVALESGDTIVRWRSTGSINRYMVNGETYEGFGGGVPLEVSQITGIRPVAIGDLNINLNLAEQLDGPFLGSSISAPARAKVLGKLAGTEEIDFAAKQLGTDLYRRNQDEKRLAGETVTLEESIKSFDWLPGMALNIEALEGLVTKIRMAQENRGKLFQIAITKKTVDGKIIAAQVILCRWRNLKQAEKTLVGVIESQRRKKTLIELANNYQICWENIWACKKVAVQLCACLPKAEERLQTAQAASQTTLQLHNLKNSYLASAETIQRSLDVVNRLQGLGAAEALLQDVGEKKRSQKMLESLSSKWTVANAAVIGTQMLTERLSGLKEAEQKATQVTESRLQWANLYVLRDRYDGILNKINDAQGQAVLWENRVAELEGAYHDLLGDVGVCPLCGATLSEMRIREVV